MINLCDDAVYALGCRLNADLFGESYETLRNIAGETGSGTDKVRDAWGNEIRYRNPGKFNTGTYDMYSIGRDKAVGDAEDSTKKSPGLGDDIANFKNPKAK